MFHRVRVGFGFVSIGFYLVLPSFTVFYFNVNRTFSFSSWFRHSAAAVSFSTFFFTQVLFFILVNIFYFGIFLLSYQSQPNANKKKTFPLTNDE